MPDTRTEGPAEAQGRPLASQRSTLPLLTTDDIGVSRLPLDRDIYIAICGRRYDESVTMERALDRMSEDQIVEDICSGELTDVQDIIVCNPVEGTSRVITEDIARKVLASEMDDYEYVTESVVPFLERAMGCLWTAEAQRESAV